MKLYYPDTGLLISALDEESQEDLRVNKNLGVYKGALYENFVAEAFIKQRLGLFYYKADDISFKLFVFNNPVAPSIITRVFEYIFIVNCYTKCYN